MSEATTPANPTDQIATVAATPVVAPDVQRYGHDEVMADLDSIEACEEVSECADGCCTFFTPRHNDECIRLAAYIERLEAERDALRDKCESGHWLSDDEWYAGERANADFLLRYHALLAEHDAVGLWSEYVMTNDLETSAWGSRIKIAHDNAERVIRGE